MISGSLTSSWRSYAALRGASNKSGPHPGPTGRALRRHNYRSENAARFAVVNHALLPGHRLMLQVQSSWFPLCDRNPQTFVPNIFWAQAGDYRKASQRVYHALGQASFIELPSVVSP